MSTTSGNGDPAHSPPHVSQPAMSTTSNMVKTAPAPSTHVPPTGPSPPNYLVLNIFNLLCCFFPFGLIGLMYSLKVDSEWSHGDHQGAYSASCMARGWGIAGIITGVIIKVIIVFVVVPSVLAT